MSWEDEATPNQIYAWVRLTEWKMDNKTKVAATKWLAKHANRKQMSAELGRVRALYIDRKLDEKNCFDSKIWDGFNNQDGVK